MRTSTQQDILAFIKDQKEATAKEIIEHVGFHPTGIFRHLQKLQEKKQIAKKGNMPRVKYYALPAASTSGGNDEQGIEQEIWRWVRGKKVAGNTRKMHCPTRDIFQARLESTLSEIKQKPKRIKSPYLLSAIIGEIGNNSFDHNLGNWPAEMGIYFAVDLTAGKIALADRGQGVLATISKVSPKAKNDQTALKVAFTEVISGRYPEQRGNGLKFVRQVVQDNSFDLQFYSGKAQCHIAAKKFTISASDKDVSGTLAIINF